MAAIELLDQDVHRDPLGTGVLQHRLGVLVLRSQVQRADVDLHRHELVPHAGAVQHQVGSALGERYLFRQLDAFEFQRATSRLIEMQTEEYLAREHRA